jgi:hypothetical protein
MSASDLEFQDWLDSLMFANRTPEEQAMWEEVLEYHLQSLSEEKDVLPPPLPWWVFIDIKDPVFVEDKDELPPPLPWWAFANEKSPQ